MATKGGPGDKYSYENILKEAKKKYPSKSNGDAIVEYIVDQEEPWKGASFEEKKAFFIKAYDKGVVELFPSDAPRDRAILNGMWNYGNLSKYGGGRIGQDPKLEKYALELMSKGRNATDKKIEQRDIDIFIRPESVGEFDKTINDPQARYERYGVTGIDDAYDRQMEMAKIGGIGKWDTYDEAMAYKKQQEGKQVGKLGSGWKSQTPTLSPVQQSPASQKPIAKSTIQESKTPSKGMAAALSNIKPTQNDIPKDEYRRLGETVDSLSPEALKSLVATLPNGKKYLDKKGEPNIEAIQKGVSDGVVGPLTNAVYSLSKNLGNIPYPKLDASAQGAINSYNVLAGLSPTYPVNGTPPAFNPADLDFKNQLAYDYQANAPAAVPPASVPSGNGATNVAPPVVNATPKRNYDGVLSDATSGLRALGAAYLAKDGLPSWRPTDDYYKNYGDLKTRSNMGLSAEAKTYAEGMRNRAFSAGAAQIGSLAGGGSSAAALGALSGLNENRFNSVNQGMLMDEAQRTLNQDKFTQAVGQDQNIDRMMYQDRYSQDMYKQQAANAAVAANLQNIQDRRDYDKTYGDGSNYQKMMDAKLQQANLSNLAYKKFLQNQGL